MADKDVILEKMKKNARDNGYFLCPDGELLSDLIDGLATNEDRYGYGACPCRISSGIKTYDSDIICPCEYRDADVDEYGMCYCSLFVSESVKQDPSKMRAVPERRPPEAQDAAMEARERMEQGEDDEVEYDTDSDDESLEESENYDREEIPVWRCVVCGYLAARETPPPICPICKAKADRFEKFGFG